MEEFFVGHTELHRDSNVDHLLGVTYADFLRVLEDEEITGAFDVLLIGKLYQSSDQITGTSQHFENADEAYSIVREAKVSFVEQPAKKARGFLGWLGKVFGKKEKPQVLRVETEGDDIHDEEQSIDLFTRLFGSHMRDERPQKITGFVVRKW